MKFFGDMGSLMFFVICALLIILFIKDIFVMTEKKSGSSFNGHSGSKKIAYVIRYGKKQIASGRIDEKSLPVQFGKSKGDNNDIIVVKDDIPKEDRAAVSKAWFYIDKKANGALMLYSADASEGKKKKMSGRPKLKVVGTGDADRERTLMSTVTLEAGKFTVTLTVED